MKSTTSPHLGEKGVPRNNFILQNASELFPHDSTTSSSLTCKMKGSRAPEALTLSQFATTYSNRLPQLVTLEGGYADMITDTVIQSGDMLKILHIKDASVAEIQVYGGSSTLMTTMNPRVRMSVIYAPDNDLNIAMVGVTFKTVSHLYQAKVMPKAVAVLQAWKNEETFIDQFDVLLPRKKVRQRTKKGILAFSTRYRNELFLPGSCKGLFCTAPDMVSLPISDIMFPMLDLLPVVLYNPANKKCLVFNRIEVQPIIVGQLVNRLPSTEIELPVGNLSVRLIIQQPGSANAGDTPLTAMKLDKVKEDSLGQHQPPLDPSYVKFMRQQEEASLLTSPHPPPPPNTFVSLKHSSSDNEVVARQPLTEAVRLTELLATSREPYLATKPVVPSLLNRHHSEQPLTQYKERLPLMETLPSPALHTDVMLGASPSGPQTPVGVSLPSPQTPVGVSPSRPQTPVGVPLPSPQTPVGVPLPSPQTPVGVPLPSPQTPVGVPLPSPQAPVGVSLPGPQTPAVAQDILLPGAQTSLPCQSGDNTGAQTSLPHQSGSNTGALTSLPRQSGDNTGAQTSLPRQSGDNTGAQTSLPRQSGDNTGAQTSLPRQSGDNTGALAVTISNTVPSGEWLCISLKSPPPSPSSVVGGAKRDSVSNQAAKAGPSSTPPKRFTLVTSKDNSTPARPTGSVPNSRSLVVPSSSNMAAQPLHHGYETAPPLPSMYQPLCDQQEDDAVDSEEDEPCVKAAPPTPPLGYITASDVLTLQELIWLHSDSFPQDVMVHSGVAKRLPENNALTLLRPKYTQVVNAESPDGSLFDIPLTTGMKFALLYDPLGNVRMAVRGFVFKGVRGLMFIHPRPKVICSKDNWSGDNVSIAESEILVLAPDQEDRSGLAVYSMLSKTRKLIPATCMSRFSTGAIHLCLHLCDIVGYVPFPFPQKVCVLKYDRGLKCYGSNVVTIRGVSKALVLCCVPISQPPPSESGQPVAFILPHNLPNLNLVVIKKSDPKPNRNSSQPTTTPPSIATPPSATNPLLKTENEPPAIITFSSPGQTESIQNTTSFNASSSPDTCSEQVIANQTSAMSPVQEIAQRNIAALAAECSSQTSAPDPSQDTDTDPSPDPGPSPNPLPDPSPGNATTDTMVTSFGDLDWSDYSGSSSSEKTSSCELLLQSSSPRKAQEPTSQRVQEDGTYSGVHQFRGTAKEPPQRTWEYEPLTSVVPTSDHYTDLVLKSTSRGSPRPLPPRKLRSKPSSISESDILKNTQNDDSYIHMNSVPIAHGGSLSIKHKNDPHHSSLGNLLAPSSGSLPTTSSEQQTLRPNTSVSSKPPISPTPTGSLPTYSKPFLMTPLSNPARSPSPCTASPHQHMVAPAGKVAVHIPAALSTSQGALGPLERPLLPKPQKRPPLPPPKPPSSYQKLVPTNSAKSEYTKPDKREPPKWMGLLKK